ncbi:unnamed protein product, partial [Urochloa humidicola]
ASRTFFSSLRFLVSSSAPAPPAGVPSARLLLGMRFPCACAVGERILPAHAAAGERILPAHNAGDRVLLTHGAGVRVLLHTRSRWDERGSHCSSSSRPPPAKYDSLESPDQKESPRR